MAILTFFSHHKKWFLSSQLGPCIYSSFATTYEVAQQKNFFPSSDLILLAVLQPRSSKIENSVFFCAYCSGRSRIVWISWVGSFFFFFFFFFLVIHSDFLAIFPWFRTLRQVLHECDLTLFEIKAGGLI